jgi:hypothetical protein
MDRWFCCGVVIGMIIIHLCAAQQQYASQVILGPPFIQNQSPLVSIDDSSFSQSGYDAQGQVIAICPSAPVVAMSLYNINTGNSLFSIYYGSTGGANWTFNQSIAYPYSMPISRMKFTEDCKTIAVSGFFTSPTHPTVLMIVDLLKNGNWTSTASLSPSNGVTPDYLYTAGDDCDICRDRSIVVLGSAETNNSLGEVVIWRSTPGTYSWSLDGTVSVDSSFAAGFGLSVTMPQSAPCTTIYALSGDPTQTFLYLWLIQYSESRWAVIGPPLLVEAYTHSLPTYPGLVTTDATGFVVVVGDPSYSPTVDVYLPWSRALVVHQTNGVMTLVQDIQPNYDETAASTGSAMGFGFGFGTYVVMTPSGGSLLIGGYGNAVGNDNVQGTIWYYQSNSTTNIGYFHLNGTAVQGPFSDFLEILYVFAYQFGWMDDSSFIVGGLTPFSSPQTPTGGFYTLIPGPCLVNPCQNGGLCRSDVLPNSNFTCVCPFNYAGVYCDQPIAAPTAYTQVGQMVQTEPPSIQRLYAPIQASFICLTGARLFEPVTPQYPSLLGVANVYDWNTDSSEYVLSGVINYAGVSAMYYGASTMDCNTVIFSAGLSGISHILVFDFNTTTNTWVGTAALLSNFGENSAQPVDIALDRTWIMTGFSAFSGVAVAYWHSIPGTFNWAYVSSLRGTGLSGSGYQAYSLRLVPSIPCNLSIWYGYASSTPNQNASVWLAAYNATSNQWAQDGPPIILASQFGSNSQNLNLLDTAYFGTNLIIAVGITRLQTSDCPNGVVYIVMVNSTFRGVIQLISPPSDSITACNSYEGFGATVWLDRVSATRLFIVSTSDDSVPNDPFGRGAFWSLLWNPATNNYQFNGRKVFGLVTDHYSGLRVTSGNMNGTRFAVATYIASGSVVWQGGTFIFDAVSIPENSSSSSSSSSSVYSSSTALIRSSSASPSASSTASVSHSSTGTYSSSGGLSNTSSTGFNNSSSSSTGLVVSSTATTTGEGTSTTTTFSSAEIATFVLSGVMSLAVVVIGIHWIIQSRRVINDYDF